MAEKLQRRIEAWATTLGATGSFAKAVASFVYPSLMTWSGRGGGIVSLAPRNQPWRNIDPLDNSAVMNCLAWIFRNFGQGVLRTVREQRDGSLKTVDVPGFADLIYKPNPFHTGFNFWAATALSYFTDGNAYWIKVRNARGFGVPTELWYEPHWSIAPHWPQDGSQFVDYYERRVNGRIQQIPVENVVHFRNGLNPANPRYGMAPLKVALLEVFTDQEAAAYTASLLKNMAIPGVVINPKTPLGLTPEKAEAIKQKFQQKFGGDNRGEPLLLDFEADVTTLGFSPNDMNFADVRRIGEERISGCFGLPAIVAGLGAGLEASTYNNLKELKKSAFEDCLTPTWNAIAEELTNQLLSDFTNAPDVMADFDTSKVAALKEDEDKRNQRVVDRVRAGVITVAQAQTDLGYTPDPAANYYLIPNNARPATAAVAMARAGQEITDSPSPDSRADSGQEPQKLLPPFKKKAYEWAGMTLRRKPTPLEQIIELKQIDEAMAAGAQSVGNSLLAMRARYIHEAIGELESLDPEDYHALVVETTDDDRSAIYGLLAQSFLSGAALIVEELNRQGAQIATVATTAPDEALLSIQSGITVSRVANDVQARVIAAAQQGELLSVEDVAEYARAQMASGSTAYVERAARAATNTSLAAGRKAEIQARKGEIRFVVYSAVLDANTCKPCGEDDGETGQEDEITPAPNPNCPGGAECRCVHIAVSDLSNVEPTPAPATTGAGAEARQKLAEIAAGTEQRVREMRAQREALAREWVASNEKRRRQLEKTIVNLDRAIEGAKVNALTAFREALYQETAANFSLDFAGDVSEFAKRDMATGAKEFARFVGAGKVDGQSVKFFEITGRPYYSSASGVHVERGPDYVIHELGHWLEDKNPAIHADILAFYERRTAGDALERMIDLMPGGDFAADELTKRDRFAHPYMGLWYEAGGQQVATEILSMGLQFFYENPVKLAQDDPEFFDFIFELLRR